MQNTHDDWYTGLVLEVNIVKNKLTSVVHPVKQAKSNYKLILASGDKKKIIKDRIQAFNEMIKDEDRLAQEWDLFSNVKYNQYVQRVFIIRCLTNKYFKVLYRAFGLTKLIRKVAVLLLNQIRCEAHLDISQSVLKKCLDRQR